jgi:cyclopropane-fatty-acyl-phospholipid synthase
MTVDRAPHRLFSRLVRVGRLELVSDRRRLLLAGTRQGPTVRLTVHHPRALIRIARGGALGFAEAYMLGEVDTPDLAEFFLWGGLNQDAFREGRLGSGLFTAARRVWQRLARDLSHRNVGSTAEHYDIGNDFYAAWLDETMSYSSARFEHRGQSLAAAQRNKYARLAGRAGIRPGDTVLEIGCGWGGFAEYVAGELGCRVTAITLSEEMASFTEKRMVERGLEYLVDVRVEDFRRITGTFDAVVSVEMIESIDEPQWPELFVTIHGRLRPGGRAAMQAITILDSEWGAYRRGRDFIQRCVFPGGQLPSPGTLDALAAQHGLTISEIEEFGLDYARTLDEWHDRFERAWPGLASKQFDEHFRRLWKLYLAYCEAGFRLGRINVRQMALQRVAG